MDQIEIDTEQLLKEQSNIVEELYQTKHQINLMLEELQALNGIWEGKTKNLVMMQFQQAYRYLKALCESLGRFFDFIFDVTDIYEECDVSIEEILNSR